MFTGCLSGRGLSNGPPPGVGGELVARLRTSRSSTAGAPAGEALHGLDSTRGGRRAQARFPGCGTTARNGDERWPAKARNAGSRSVCFTAQSDVTGLADYEIRPVPEIQGWTIGPDQASFGFG